MIILNQLLDLLLGKLVHLSYQTIFLVRMQLINLPFIRAVNIEIWSGTHPVYFEILDKIQKGSVMLLVRT